MPNKLKLKYWGCSLVHIPWVQFPVKRKREKKWKEHKRKKEKEVEGETGGGSGSGARDKEGERREEEEMLWMVIPKELSIWKTADTNAVG